MKAYYNETAENLQKMLNGSMDPLTDAEIKERQKRYGPNELAEGKKKSGLQIFLEQ